MCGVCVSRGPLTAAAAAAAGSSLFCPVTRPSQVPRRTSKYAVRTRVVINTPQGSGTPKYTRRGTLPKSSGCPPSWVEPFAGRARFASMPNFLSSLPLICFLSLPPPSLCSSDCNSGRPLELLHLSPIAERSLSPSPSRKQSPLPVCASQPRSCASSLVASRSRRPRKARRTTATTGTGGDGATVSGPLARRNVPTVSITASLGSGTCG